MARQSLNIPYLALGGIIVIAVVLAVIVFQPQLARIRETSGEADVVAANLAERQEFLRTIDRKAAELARQRAHETELDVVLPADESFDDMLRIIDRTAATAGVTVTQVSNNSSSVQSSFRAAQARGNDTGAPQGIQPLGANISFRGSYQQVRTFIASLEQVVRLVNMSRLSLQASPEQPDVLEAELSIEFYSFSTSDTN